jgi:enoyl-CoA hydratase/carnithine racemase
MYRHLQIAFEGRLARLTLDRPERRNAFSAELMREMIACAGELAARRDLDAVIVAGAGGVFSAGADLKDSSRWAGGAPLLEQREIAGLGGRMARAWEELPQMTIAAIEGYAVGGGLALAAALDWRVLARNAFVSLPEISLGIPLTWGMRTGPGRARRGRIGRQGPRQAEALGDDDQGDGQRLRQPRRPRRQPHGPRPARARRRQPRVAQGARRRAEKAQELAGAS